ncbi:MAG: AI-2E family transporter [Caldilineaceae bacterium]
MKRLAYILVIVLSTLTLILIIWQLRSIVLLFFVSLAIAAAMNAPIQHFINLQLSRSVALLLTYLLVIGGLLLLATLLSGPLVLELDLFTRDLIRVYEQGSRAWGETLPAMLPTADTVTAFLAGTSDASPITSVVGITQGTVNLISQLLLAIVLSIYWAVDSQRFERLWLSLLQAEQRTAARRNWHAVEANVGTYIRSEVGQSLLVGGLVTLGLWVVGAKYLFLPAFVAAVAWLIPLVGGLIAVVGVVLIGWLSGLFVVVFSLIYTILILFLMEFVVERYLYGQDGYSSILVLLAMIAMADAFGVIGLLVAPPLALVIQVFWREFIEVPSTASQRITTPNLNEIQQRLAALHLQVAQGEVSPRVMSLVERLDTLMGEVEHTLPYRNNT